MKSLPIPYHPYHCLTSLLPLKNGTLIAVLLFLPIFGAEETNIRVYTYICLYTIFRSLTRMSGCKVVRMVRMVRKRSTAILFPILHSGKGKVRMVRNEKLQSYKKE